jgi:hypothetical protein
VDYRVYCLDGNGHIGFAEWIIAANVEEAIEQVRVRQPRAHRCEIWLKKDMVAKLNGIGVFERLGD